MPFLRFSASISRVPLLLDDGVDEYDYDEKRATPHAMPHRERKKNEKKNRKTWETREMGAHRLLITRDEVKGAVVRLDEKKWKAVVGEEEK